MDRFTRNVIILFAVLLGLLGLSLAPGMRHGIQPRIWQLDALLKEDPVLAAYPYRFQALLFINGVLTLSRPYDDTLPSIGVLPLIEPELVGKAADSPEMNAARDRLWRHEMQAINLMISQPDVDSVIWSLDRAWLIGRGVKLGPPPPIRPY